MSRQLCRWYPWREQADASSDADWGGTDFARHQPYSSECCSFVFAHHRWRTNGATAVTENGRAGKIIGFGRCQKANDMGHVSGSLKSIQGNVALQLLSHFGKPLHLLFGETGINLPRRQNIHGDSMPSQFQGHASRQHPDPSFGDAVRCDFFEGNILVP